MNISRTGNIKTRLLGWLGVVAAVGRVHTACAGVTWPASQYLPTFATPAAEIQCIDMDSLPTAEQTLFCSLEGIVNRTQPQLACVSAASEGEFTWMSIHGLPYETVSGYSAVLEYETNVTGLVVNDPNEPDTLNLATTIAGVKNELICDPSLLSTLTNSPYNLAIQDDLRGMFTNKYQVYGYLYSNYWSQCTHRMIAGLETNNYWYLRDYLVALKSAVVWLDPTVAANAATLASMVSNMAPVGAIYTGWWPNEGGDMQWIAQYGIPVMASDLFDNGTVYGGVTTPITIQPIPPAPPLQNKVYVSLTLSDGDNVQYMQHTMKQNWGSSARGTIPIGWTVQPLLADFDPGMLNYYTSTATTNDCLVAGPSGSGYTRINYWSAGNVANYTKASNHYLQRTGIRAITVWLTLSGSTATNYAANCPTLVGVNDYNDGSYTTNYNGSLPVVGFPTNGNYAANASNLVTAITNAAASWNGASPMFIAVEGSAWDVTPASLQTVAGSLSSSKYIVVRPDHLFLLYQKAAGLGAGGAAPYVAAQPASQSGGAGSNATFSVTASGTGPLNYQWTMDGTNIASATNTTYTRPGVQTADAGTYQVVVSNLYGAVTSAVAVLMFGSQPLSFNGNGLSWSVNQNGGYYPYSATTMVSNILTLTDGAGSEARSFFCDKPQYIGAFQASFTYQAGGDKGADGASFCIQNDPRGPLALGGGGGSLGVGTANPITPSVELELNLYTGNSQNLGYTVLSNGLVGSSGNNGNYRAPGNIRINSGDPINVTVKYANEILAVTFTDAVSNISYNTNIILGDLTQILGSSNACIGFTGADGGSTSIQTISHFSFVSLPPVAIQSHGTNASVSWPGGAPGYLLQENSDLTQTNWLTLTNPAVLSNGLYQAAVSETASDLYFRLVLPTP